MHAWIGLDLLARVTTIHDIMLVVYFVASFCFRLVPSCLSSFALCHFQVISACGSVFMYEISLEGVSFHDLAANLPAIVALVWSPLGAAAGRLAAPPTPPAPAGGSFVGAA